MWLVRQQQQRRSTELWTHWLIAPALAADSWKITANLFNFSHSLISVQGFASSSCYMAFAPCCFSSTAVLTLWLMEEVTHLEYLSFSECCWGKEKLTNMTELLFLDWMHFLAKKKKRKKGVCFFLHLTGCPMLCIMKSWWGGLRSLLRISMDICMRNDLSNPLQVS